SWLSSFRTRIRAYGTTSATRTREAAATVLFHPDYNRRPRNHTESADPSSQAEKKALAGLGYVTLTAGGDFHPALRTSAARNGRPARRIRRTPGPQQAALTWGIGMSLCRGNRARARPVGAFTWAAAIGIGLLPKRGTQHETSSPEF